MINNKYSGYVIPHQDRELSYRYIRILVYGSDNVKNYQDLNNGTVYVSDFYLLIR